MDGVDDQADELTLEAVPAGGGVSKELAELRRQTRETYQKPQAWYAQFYGYHEHNIKKWRRLGRAAVPMDLPPLDDPAAMPAWWGRHMKQRVPARLLECASKAGVAAEDKTAGGGGELPRPGRPAAVEVLADDGFAGVVLRARAAERTAYTAWQNVLGAEVLDPGAEEMRRRAWERATEIVRKLEKDADGIMAGKGEVATWAEFEEVITPKLAALNQSIRSLPVRVATKLALSPDLFQRLVGAFQAELDQTFAAMGESGFARPAAPREELVLQAA